MPGPYNLTQNVVSLLASASLVLLSCCSDRESPAAGIVPTALPVYLEAFGGGMSLPNPNTRMVDHLLGRGDVARAQELSLAAAEAVPEDGEAAFIHGVVLNTTASFSMARIYLERAIAYGPSCTGSERVFYYYGVCLMRLGEGALARESFLAHLEIRPKDGITRSVLGELALQEGDPELALVDFRLAITLFESEERRGVPTGAFRARTQIGIADALLQQGHLEQAMEAAQLSVALDPTDAQAWYKLSRIQTRLGHEEEALASFRRFAQLGAGR